MYDRASVTPEWHLADRPGQLAALVALLFAPEVERPADERGAA
jgi:hypothetical protein